MRRGLVAAALIFSVACGPSAKGPAPTDASASSDVFVATPLPTPRTTPPGTPGPIPSEMIAQSASIETPPPPPNPTATPTAEPGLWRIEGYVVDESGAPVPSVCVVVGPNGCKLWSPHTDDRGHWFLDVAEGQASFDFYFEIPGFKTTWWHVTPTGPTEFNVILAKG